jgi:hypothetical protein
MGSLRLVIGGTFAAGAEKPSRFAHSRRRLRLGAHDLVEWADLALVRRNHPSEHDGFWPAMP